MGARPWEDVEWQRPCNATIRGFYTPTSASRLGLSASSCAARLLPRRQATVAHSSRTNAILPLSDTDSVASGLCGPDTTQKKKSGFKKADSGLGQPNTDSVARLCSTTCRAPQAQTHGARTATHILAVVRWGTCMQAEASNPNVNGCTGLDSAGTMRGRVHAPTIAIRTARCTASCIICLPGATAPGGHLSTRAKQ